MRLASFQVKSVASYGAVTEKGIVDLGKRIGNRYPDLKSLIRENAFAEAKKLLSHPPDFRESEVTWLPVIPNPGKIVCVGLNYEEHRAETGRDKTEHPALFLRVAESQVAHRQPILMPAESTNLDYEGEIAVIIGKPGRRISQEKSWQHIAGYACYNDGSVRDWQRPTLQWTAGKNFNRTGGFGPGMGTPRELPDPGE